MRKIMRNCTLQTLRWYGCVKCGINLHCCTSCVCRNEGTKYCCFSFYFYTRLYETHLMQTPAHHFEVEPWDHKPSLQLRCTLLSTRFSDLTLRHTDCMFLSKMCHSMQDDSQNLSKWQNLNGCVLESYYFLLD